ncbi:MerR family transcriptional regulator [Nocardia aurea]|uniref:MerR family transcriptional regulator n=1 Tax=Nocardia aurea TaxID=2144174 RepID=A0ABV3FSS9_9NOCA
MLIADAARSTGATPRALRWYEQYGLISPRRTVGGYRVYDSSDLRRVRHIRELLELGFTLEQLRDYSDLLDRDIPADFSAADSPRCRVALEQARRRLAEIDDRMARIAADRARLAARLGR